MAAVTIVESPRLMWQNLPKPMPAEIKADYLRTLIAAGFKYIDAVSFVGRALVPQMADSELVLEYLDPPDDVGVAALIWDSKGTERAIKSGSIQTLVFPYSLSPTFLQREQNLSLEDALDLLEEVGTLAYKAGLDLVANVSMAFGNPLGDDWSVEEAVNAVDLLVESGVSQITLDDTAGRATPKLISDLLSDITSVHERTDIGLHLRSQPEEAPVLVRAAFLAGCRRFNSVLGGFDSTVTLGNTLAPTIPTEVLLTELRSLNAELGDLRPLEGILHAASEITLKYGARVQ